MANWFGDSFRKVHLLYVSPPWAKSRGEKFDPVAYADAYEEAGVDCVELYCKDHHGVCYFPCSLGLPYPRDILGELLPELQKRRIRLIAYVSVCFDNYALGIHPDWRAANPVGDPHKTGPFFHASISSPYADFVLTQIDELAARYDVDGFWLDIIPLARDLKQELWMIAPNPVPDFSLHAQKRWRAATGRGLSRHPDETEADEIFEFQTAEVDAFLKRAYDAIRKHRPQAVITYNAAGAPGDPIDSADLVSIEGHAPHYARQSFIARWARASPKPFEMMTAGGLPRVELGGGWNALDQKPVNVLRLEAAIALSHGGSTLIGQVPYANGATDPAQFDGLMKVFQPIKAMEPYVRGASGIADIGLALAAKPRQASRHWYRMQDGAEAFHQALLDEHLQYDVIRLTGELSRYSGIVLAEQSALSGIEIEALRNYVRDGGRLLATGASSLFDEHGNRRSDFGLADVFGVSYRGVLAADFVYLRLADEALCDAVTGLPILIDKQALHVESTGAKQLAMILEPESLRTDATTILWGDASPEEERSYPGLTQNTFGEGTCWYLPVSPKANGFPNAWTKQLMRALLRRLAPDQVLLTSAPPGVEVTLNRQPGRLIVHLVNYHVGDPDRLSVGDHIASFAGITVKLNLARLDAPAPRLVAAVPASEPAHRVEDGWLTISVPSLDIHQMLIVECWPPR